MPLPQPTVLTVSPEVVNERDAHGGQVSPGSGFMDAAVRFIRDEHCTPESTCLTCQYRGGCSLSAERYGGRLTLVEPNMGERGHLSVLLEGGLSVVVSDG